MEKDIYPINYKGKSRKADLAKKQKIRIHHHHFHFFYETTLKRHLTTIVAVNIISLFLIFLVLHFVNPSNVFDINQISQKVILIATINTFLRLLVAYIFSVIVAIPLALLIVSTPFMQKVLLPISDILQSIPVLAFFPGCYCCFYLFSFI